MAARNGSTGWRRALRRTLAGLAALAATAAFLGLVYLGLTWDLRGDADPDAAFRPVPVERGTLPERVVATGALEPFATVVVQSEIPGIVARVFVDDGERVAEGEPLVELDRERLQDRVDELRAALDHRKALARVRLVERARARVSKARRDLARARDLFDRGVLSRKALDEAEHAFELAELGLGDAAAERDARRAARAEAAEALERAERDLAKAVIRSPVDGVVIRRSVEVGTAVADLQNGGTVVAVLADDRRIHLRAEVDENDVARVRAGQSAEVHLDAFPDESFEGTVRRVSSSGTDDGGISNFRVEIELAPDARVRVGMSADARIAVGAHEDVLIVPNEAIVRDHGGPRVRRPAEDRSFALVPVEEIYSDGFRTAVAGSLAEGDAVLVRDDGSAPWAR